jgi:hypothetical protein
VTFDWQTALRDGALVALAASALVMATLRANPRLLMRHFPAELRVAVPPLTSRERPLGKMIGLALIALLVTGPWISTATAFPHEGTINFGSAFAHAFVVSMVFNAVDWLVLDEAWLGGLRPAWAMLPGAEAVPFKFNHLQHARGFVVGSILWAVIAGLVAWAVTL